MAGEILLIDWHGVGNEHGKKGEQPQDIQFWPVEGCVARGRNRLWRAVHDAYYHRLTQTEPSPAICV